MAAVELRDVEMVYPGGVQAVGGVCLHVDQGGMLVLVGPSGCGKTTLLRLIAGLESPTAGEVRIGGRSMRGVPPRRRNVAMVFQHFTLDPQRTVRGNLEFPLRMRRTPRGQRRARAEEAAALVGIAPLLERMPGNLSGGERQRAALARALVRRPDVLLLDEPLSNLDAQLRYELRGEIFRLQQQLGATTLYVTHDQAEAMTLGGRLAVLRGGRIQQSGAAAELYERPASAFVARFLGTPPMNLFAARRIGGEGEGQPRLDLGDCRAAIPPALARRYPRLPGEGAPLLVGLRPEALALAAEGDGTAPAAEGGEAVLPATVLRCETPGHERIVWLSRGAAALPCSPPCDDAGGSPDGNGAALCAVRQSADLPAPRPGETLRLQLDLRRAVLFDERGGPLG